MVATNEAEGEEDEKNVPQAIARHPPQNRDRAPVVPVEILEPA